MNFKEYFRVLKTNDVKRIKLITLITMVYNFVWSIVKIFFGFFSTMYFFCVSGVVTLILGFTKKIFYSNYQSESEQIRLTKSRLIGILLILIGVLFAGYMAKLFFIPEKSKYDLIVSIAIAFCSFLELGISIFYLYKDKRTNDNILLTSIRYCNLADGLFAIVLTQMAILSAQTENTINTSMYNGVVGIVMSVLVVLLGIIILLKVNKINKDKNK